ncbi:MAG: transcription initiation factor IIB [Nitrososphaerota archaeon]|nr:transcription initiation factor IIB [Nitrososphaerota archaeon]
MLRKSEWAIDRCPRCAGGPMVADTSGGELFCSSCGYVLKERMVEAGLDWRAYTPEEAIGRAHTGPPSRLSSHDMGLATVIGKENKDASGRMVSASMRGTIERLRTWDGRSHANEYEDRNRRQAFSELDRMVDKLNLSDAVVEKAAYMYRKALERGLIRGRSISGIIAACLYAACRDMETPRTLKDISAVSCMKKKELARWYRLLFKELDLRMPVVDPVKCVSRIASRARVRERTQRRALEILRRVEDARTSAGKDPMGLAAAALYVACVLEHEDKTQKELADAASVTEVTIRNRYKGLKAVLDV